MDANLLTASQKYLVNILTMSRWTEWVLYPYGIHRLPNSQDCVAKMRSGVVKPQGQVPSPLCAHPGWCSFLLSMQRELILHLHTEFIIKKNDITSLQKTFEKALKFNNEYESISFYTNIKWPSLHIRWNATLRAAVLYFCT